MLLIGAKLLCLLAPLVLFWRCRTLFLAQSLRGMFALTSLTALLYWYYVPATLFIIAPDQLEDDAFLAEFPTDFWKALIYLGLSAVGILVGVLLDKHERVQVKNKTENAPQLLSDLDCKILSLVSLISAVGFLILRYAESGAGLLWDLLLGADTARAYLSFENFSEGATQSLIALWEIVSLYWAVLSTSIWAFRRGLADPWTALSAAAVVLLFVASGTRSYLLVLIVAIGVISVHRRWSSQSGDASDPNLDVDGGPDGHSLVRRGIGIALVILASWISVRSLFARFTDAPEVERSVVYQLLSSNNDMFRELVFVFRYSGEYSHDVFNFVISPLSFALPRFLGFDKQIPAQLVDFNLDRTGIDLVYGAGNVFPGTLGDFFMAFGWFAPLALFLCSILSWTLAAFVMRNRDDVELFATTATLCGFYFVAMRNISGYFAILFVLAAVTLPLFRRLQRIFRKMSL